MLGANLGLLLYGEVSVMVTTGGVLAKYWLTACPGTVCQWVTDRLDMTFAVEWDVKL